ncbi:IclR family transcriptional regulator C-terminal domain-containing protein [Citricoccus parietis]
MVLLASAPAAVRQDVLASPLKRYTDHTITDPDTLRRMLAEVHRTGVAVLTETITLGTFAVGVPVRGPSERVVAALSVTLKIDGSRTVHQVLPALNATARALSRALGSASSGISPPGAPGSAVQPFAV